MKRLAGFLSRNDQLALKLASAVDSLQLFCGDVSRTVSQVGVKVQRFELETLYADYLSAVLPLTTCRAQPVLVLEEQFLDREWRCLFFLFFNLLLA